MSYWAVARLEPRREQLAPRASDLTRTRDRDPAAALSGLLFPHRRGAMVRRPLEPRHHRPDHGWYPAATPNVRLRLQACIDAPFRTDRKDDEPPKLN